jgi:histone H3/H4
MSADGGEPPDEADYATRIEEAFIAERGTPFLLSAKDWQLIRGWRDGGIPVDTVVRAVRETFAKRRARGAAGKIASISYCAGAVEERWQMERRGLVGRGDEGRSETPVEIGPRLERLVRALRSAAHAAGGEIEEGLLQKEIGKAVSKIEALPHDGSFDETEEKLSKIEAALVRRLARALGPAAAAAVETAASEALGETAGIAEEIVDRMRKALVRREVRRRLGLPFLTLL